MKLIQYKIYSVYLKIILNCKIKKTTKRFSLKKFVAENYFLQLNDQFYKTRKLLTIQS